MSDLWSVTIPGYATGVGTVLLVAVTAAIMWRDRRKDKQEALRDARKVFGIASEAPSEHVQQTLTVHNAGVDPIFEVTAVGSDRARGRTAWLVWVPKEHFERVWFVLPGSSRDLPGEWKIHLAKTGHEVTPINGMADWVYAQSLLVTVQWTDGRGDKWERVGSAEPRRRKS